MSTSDISQKFVLQPHCFLVRGSKNAAIYDLDTGHIYSIDSFSVQILELCEQNICISKISERFSQTVEFFLNYLKPFEQQKLGFFTDKENSFEKIALIPPKKEIKLIWLELVHDCNQACIHCFGNCPIRPASVLRERDSLTFQQWKSVVRDAFVLGGKCIQFTGGEPMLFGKDIFKLIEQAKILGYERIEIFTNATLLDDDDISLLAQYGVIVATNIYSKNPCVHDSITRIKGSWGATIKNIEKMKKAGVRVLLATVLMEQNASCIEETVEFTKSLGEVNPLKHFDFVRPVGRGEINSVLSNKLIAWSQKRQPIFSKITLEEFSKRKYGHSCWWGNIAIASNGNVFPCLMARGDVCGNLKDQTLEQILNGVALTEKWSLSKDYIEICKDCEYRYACMDCRPLALGEGQGSFGRRKSCLYNPYIGLWGDLNK